MIIEGLFAGQPIDKIRTAAQARLKLGKLPVATQKEYYPDFLKHNDLFRYNARATTLGKFLRHIEVHPKSELVITEQPSPSALIDLLEVPELCGFQFEADGTQNDTFRSICGRIWTDGSFNFDWDHRHVLLHQVFGRKRAFLVRPEKSALLNPVLNMSFLNVEALSEERAATQVWLGAIDETLYPGDTLYIPPLMWHSLEYIDTSMSVSFRFGRTCTGESFQELFHPNMYLQNFAWNIVNKQSLSGVEQTHYERMMSIWSAPKNRGFELYQKMQIAFEEAYKECCPNAVQTFPWYVDERLLTEQAMLGIRAGMLYQTPLREGDYIRTWPNGAAGWAGADGRVVAAGGKRGARCGARRTRMRS